jgi:hypothetical protein
MEEDTRIYNYIDLIDIPSDDFFGMWYYELDSERLDEAKLPPHYLTEIECRMEPVPIIAFIFFYKEQAIKVKEKLQNSDKDKRVVSFNWLSSDIKKRKAPRIDSKKYLSLFPIKFNQQIDFNELEKYDETHNYTPRWMCLDESTEEEIGYLLNCTTKARKGRNAPRLRTIETYTPVLWVYQFMSLLGKSHLYGVATGYPEIYGPPTILEPAYYDNIVVVDEETYIAIEVEFY